MCVSEHKDAGQIVEAIGADPIIFLPDEYLAKNTADETGKRIIFPTRSPRPAAAGESANLEYELIGWHGAAIQRTPPSDASRERTLRSKFEAR